MKQGQIVRVLAGSYSVYSDHQTYECRARGKFRNQRQKPMAGDFCEFNEVDGYMMSLLPRKNELLRPPLANVDQCFVVMSCHEPEFSTALLDRFLIEIEAKQIEAMIVVSKCDLLVDNDPVLHEIEAYQKAGYTVILTGKELDDHRALIPYFKDKLSVFTGQSGVGKSSLMNRLMPELELNTQEISKALGRGKHTTRHVELYHDYEGWIADTPGFSSLELYYEPRELSEAYHDFRRLSSSCKFRGCLHQHEPDCAVKQAVEEGKIAKSRYEHYLAFLEEVKSKKGKY